MVVLSILVVLVAGAVAALAVGRIGQDASVAMPEPVHTTGHDVLPPGEVTRADIAGIRFDRAVRGYRMDQVDAVLDRLTEAIAERDARIAELTHGEYQPSAASVPAPADPPASPGQGVIAELDARRDA